MDTIIYWIDKEDKITMVNDSWDEFLGHNSGPASCASSRVIGKSIWSYITGTETKKIYKNLFEKIRHSMKVFEAPFRCDSPDTRRYLTMEIAPLSDNALQIRCVLQKQEKRELVPLLDKLPKPHSDTCLHICSICCSTHLNNHAWIEIEDYILQSHLLEDGLSPRIVYKVCPSCKAIHNL